MQYEKRLRRCLAATVTVAIFVFVSVQSVVAALSCGPTPQDITTNTTLQFDYEITSGTCFKIPGGVTLDLNGHSITCTSSSCDAAVLSNVNGTVKNGLILGPFDIAVENSGEARELRIDGSDVAIGCSSGANQAGCVNAKQIEKNVLLNCGSSCIDTNLLSATSFVRDNFVDGADIGIRINGSGGAGAKIEKNFIRNYVTHGILKISGGARIWDNILCERDQDIPIKLLTSADLDGNICDDLTACPIPDVPFTLP